MNIRLRTTLRAVRCQPLWLWLVAEASEDAVEPDDLTSSDQLDRLLIEMVLFDYGI